MPPPPQSHTQSPCTPVIKFLSCAACAAVSTLCATSSTPNVILIYADDISARELPIYGSSVWSKPDKGDSSDTNYRAQTPVLDALATSSDGAWFTQAWAATVCSPSRAMMMTGRYASLHKWWHNGDLGTRYDDPSTKLPFYESSDFLIGHVAQLAGYATIWCGKTQMKGPDMFQFGFDEGVWTPGEGQNTPGSNDTATDFRLTTVNGTLTNRDTGLAADSYAQVSWYWKPSVVLMNHPSAPDTEVVWAENPNTADTYGPDVELDFIFDFIERQHAKDKPFFVYHTTHLGHDAFDWLDPDSTSSWPATPKIQWNPTTASYARTTPQVTGDNGVYDTHNTLSEPGIHAHVEYLDYQVWRYLQKLQELGIENDTILIFSADNGSSGYGKGSHDRQKGTHVPLIVYAPGQAFTKSGEQDKLISIADILPTLQDIMNVRLPASYEVHGQSFWPYLTTESTATRDWIYAYKEHRQLVRGSYVMKDGNEKWWDVSGSEPTDLISYPEITDWNAVSQAHRDERDELLASVLPAFDLHASEHDEPAPVIPAGPNSIQHIPVLQDVDVKAGAADTNYDGLNFLKIAGNQPRYAYLQFDLSGLTTPPQQSKLWVRNYSSKPVDATLDVFAAGNSEGGTSTLWDEATLTFNTKPDGDPITQAIHSAILSDADTWYSIDLSSHISGSGLYTFGLSTSNPTVADAVGQLYSKDSGHGAYLELISENTEDYDALTYWLYVNGLKYPDWDDDGDGENNELEFIAGTDPNDINSRYQANGAHSQTGDYEIRFNTVAGRSYTVQWTSDLDTPTWNDLTGAINLSGTGTEMSATDTDSSNHRFYRVTVELE